MTQMKSIIPIVKVNLKLSDAYILVSGTVTITGAGADDTANN